MSPFILLFRSIRAFHASVFIIFLPVPWNKMSNQVEEVAADLSKHQKINQMNTMKMNNYARAMRAPMRMRENKRKCEKEREARWDCRQTGERERELMQWREVKIVSANDEHVNKHFSDHLIFCFCVVPVFSCRSKLQDGRDLRSFREPNRKSKWEWTTLYFRNGSSRAIIVKTAALLLGANRHFSVKHLQKFRHLWAAFEIGWLK